MSMKFHVCMGEYLYNVEIQGKFRVEESLRKIIEKKAEIMESCHFINFKLTE